MRGIFFFLKKREKTGDDKEWICIWTLEDQEPTPANSPDKTEGIIDAVARWTMMWREDSRRDTKLNSG